MNVGPILLNDFKRQWHDTSADVLAAVSRVGASGWYVLGDSVRKFEANLEAYLGAGFCTGCASGARSSWLRAETSLPWYPFISTRREAKSLEGVSMTRAARRCAR